MDKIRVVIADDHVLVREGLRKLLELDDSIDVITEVGDGQGAINIARKEKPDIILMDVNIRHQRHYSHTGHKESFPPFTSSP